MPGEEVKVRVEVFDDHLMVVLPYAMDDLVISWQEAAVLGETMEQAAEDIPNKPVFFEPVATLLDSYKLRAGKYKDKYVRLVFDHTDRIKLGYEVARIVGRTIRQHAQDLDLLTRGVRMLYSPNGQVMPSWTYKRRVF